MKVVNKEIDMVVWFKTDGELRPLKIRLNEEGENIVIKVKKVIAKNVEKIAGRTVHSFRCQSVINGVEKVYELRYIADKIKWILFKI